MKNTTLLFLFSLLLFPQVYGQVIDKPNIVIFYVDDLGWQDTNLNNLGDPVPWETPKMEALAAAGAKFSQAYSPAPTCAPSRAAMLSGRHPIKTKVTQVSGGGLPILRNSQADRKMIGPYFPKRLDVNEYTIAEALSTNGYHTGHVGKWHVDGANGFPVAVDQGFDTEFTSRGVNQNMGDRYDISNFGGNDPNYPLDADGIPYDSVTDEAVAYMENRVAANGGSGEPFFLYMATWLVHTPIQTRDLPMLQAITQTLVNSGQIDAPDVGPNGIPTETTPLTAAGEYNPFYGAMVQTVDWSLGKLVDYLQATSDPRHPGKTLFETTYIIFSSDNGASEQNNAANGFEVVADNFPLDLGKTSSREGGIRVPMIVTGPEIPVAEYSNVVNGLDFFPTILSLTGTTIASNLSDDFDGADLSDLLKGTNSIVEQTRNGVTTERTDLFWHYPNASDERSKSSIRRGNYKLYKNYIDNTYEAYQLYNEGDNLVDVEETINVITTMDQTLKQDMIDTLEAYLIDNDARFPAWNPDYAEPDGPLVNQNLVPAINSVTYDENSGIATAVIANSSGEAVISYGHLLYRKNEQNEEWFEAEAVTINDNIITANVPDDASGIVFNLRDENNFLVLSEELEIVNITKITLNTVDEVQMFEPEESDVYGELIGGATANSSFIQMRTVGGGDGFNINVKAEQSVVCEKVVFHIRSREGDTVNFDVTIGDETQSFEYTSTRDADDLYYEYNVPTTFTESAQTMEVLVTDLINADNALPPRFRVYDITFHLDLESLGVDDVEDNLQDLLVFPNPAKGVFSLNKPVESGVLYNIHGAKTLEFKDQYQNIDISRINSGLYFLQVTNKDGDSSTLKLIKQ
ncbi:Arylsulfatase [Winogradskyella psychrotolerans RS-3]|uniref:Arylsulfatase n=1 Tax=Winogradskyella psychrotolerans RS-3 TaxID=641526 RepID=S7X2I2_9FLAO|nr:sulfatase-like hydrolase/transferase [Winogradskyella psychrotolerans]EPR73199.1 Arylsulfatase [Winogradskyella psychrotolerans RS-3]